MSRLRPLPLTVAIAVWLGFAALAGAHALRPSFLELREMGQGAFAVTWKHDVRATEIVAPILPAPCRTIGHVERRSMGEASIERWQIHCGPSGLASATIPAPRADEPEVLVRLAPADGPALSTVLRPGQAGWTVPAARSTVAVGLDYLALGVRHILAGFDHLLFVLALLGLVPGGRRLVATITAFTAAHSVTLSAAALQLVRLPVEPVEAVIALSLLLLATELARAPDAPPGLATRKPWLVAFSFGLLHGFGFAGALAEICLPAGETTVALVTFNLGVELGQLAVVALALGLARLARTVAARAPVRRSLTYGVGALASFWSLERITAFFDT